MRRDFWIASVALLIRNIAAEQVSEEQCMLQQPNDSTLKCWGDDVQTREYYKIPDGVSLARFCRRSPVFMECGRALAPNYPFFNNVASISKSRTPIWSDMPYTTLWTGNDLRTLYHSAMLLCSEKCTCNDQAPDKAQDPPKGYKKCFTLGGGNTLDYSAKPATFVYDFDKKDVRVSKVPPKEKYKEFYGPAIQEFDAVEIPRPSAWRPFPMPLDARFKNPSKTTLDLQQVFYVGHPKNDVTCSAGDEADAVEDALGPDVSNFISSMFGGTMPSAQKLCAHSFYGGESHRNMGAVCKAGSQGKLELSIEWERISPQFLPEYYTWRLLSFAALPFIEAFCSAACECQGEDENAINARLTFYQKLMVGAAIPQKGIFLTGGGGGGTPATASSGPAATNNPTDLRAEFRAQVPILQQRLQAGGGGNGQAAGTGMQALEIQGAPGPSRNRACSSNRDCTDDQVCLATTRSTLRDLGSAILSIFCFCVVRDAVDINNGKPKPGG